MQSDPVTVTEAETIDFDWVQPESQLMRRAKAHFDRLGIAYYEKSSDFYFGEGALRVLDRAGVDPRSAGLPVPRFQVLAQYLAGRGQGPATKIEA